MVCKENNRRKDHPEEDLLARRKKRNLHQERRGWGKNHQSEF